jgi:predicted ArsR family transcriptional regulator
MPTDDFARRVAGVAALAEPVRRDLYEYVVASPDAVGRDEAASGVGVPRHTAKFHLDKLVEEGLLETEFRRLSGRKGPGAGRPAKLYRRAAGEVAVSLPERDYALAGALMAQAIEAAARDGGSVVDALHRAAAQQGEALGELTRAGAGTRPSRERLLTAACRTLAEHGYEPRLRERDRTVTLVNCPFHALASEHTELVCGMNLALLDAAAQRAGDGRLTARLDPAPDRCCVVLAAP